MIRMLNVGTLSPRLSYFIRSEGPNVESATKAFGWLLLNSKPRGYMAVHGYRNLDGVLAEVIGEPAVKALKGQGKFAISGKEITLVTERKSIYNAHDSPMVAFHPSSKFLDELDSIPGISAMLVVPWNFYEVEPWIRARGAVELGMPLSGQEGPTVQNKVVERALQSLTRTVNLSTGVMHPSDRASAIQMFQILRNAGERFTPEEVKAWLIGKGGWKATHAQDAADIARKVLEGRRLRTGPMRVWADDILEQWRAEPSNPE